MRKLEFGWFLPTAGDTTAYGVASAQIAPSLELFDKVTAAAEAAGFEYMRASARATGSAGIRCGVGYLSSRYSRMIVESKIRAAPSISAGTSLRGLAVANGPSALPVPIAPGVCLSKTRLFSRRAIFTFCA